MATTSMSVFRNLDCLSLVVCSNTTLLKLQTALFLFFSKFCALKSGVRLIYGCGLYTDVYGTRAEVTGSYIDHASNKVERTSSTFTLRCMLVVV